jgi:hypothetical protein
LYSPPPGGGNVIRGGKPADVREAHAAADVQRYKLNLKANFETGLSLKG